MRMALIIFGPNGSGKGTQATLLSDYYKIPSVSTGDIFREIIKNPDKFSYMPNDVIETVKATYPKYVKDDITNEIVKSRLNEDDCKNGFILDGYPRTTPQAEYLDKMLIESSKKLGYEIELFVINLVVDEEVLLKRQLYRVNCQNEKCGSSYNTIFNPPKIDDVCDKCGSKLYERSDDTEEKIRIRTREYEKKAKPLIEYYREKERLIDVDGNKKPEEIFEQIKKILYEKVK